MNTTTLITVIVLEDPITALQVCVIIIPLLKESNILGSLYLAKEKKQRSPTI